MSQFDERCDCLEQLQEHLRLQCPQSDEEREAIDWSIEQLQILRDDLLRQRVLSLAARAH